MASSSAPAVAGVAGRARSFTSHRVIRPIRSTCILTSGGCLPTPWNGRVRNQAPTSWRPRWLPVLNRDCRARANLQEAGMSNSKTLRAGVIGAGWAGQQHLAAYAEASELDLVALAGKEADLLAALGEQYGIATDLRFADWQALLDHAELDVVSIAAPTTLHRPIAVTALDHGIHVLCEKPIAEDAPTARQMVEAAERNDRVLDVVFNHRRRGDVQALKKIIDAGLIGDIYYAKAGWLRREGIPGLGSWFTRRAVAGGGPLMDIGVHMLDMTLHLLGEPQVQTATAATYAEFGPRGRGFSVESTMRKSGVEDDGSFDVE